MPSLFSSTTRTLAFCMAVALSGLAIGKEESITSANHPALQRALNESPDADKNADGQLSLEEYSALLGPQRPNDPENPKAPLLPVRPDGDLVIHDFEENNLGQNPGWSPVHPTPLKDSSLGSLGGSWQREGDAFNRDLQSGTKMMRRRVGPFEGRLFLTTIGNSQRAVGSLRSPVFLLEQDYIQIRMSGGGHPGQICVNLHTSEGIVRSATGSNDDYFENVVLDVRKFRGQFARVELRDQHRGLWGHLNVDEILMTSRPGDSRVISTRPAPSVPTGGLVISNSGRRQGALTLENGQLSCEGKVIGDQVFLAVNSLPQNISRLPGAVRLLNGEVWNAEVKTLEGAGRRKQLNIRSQIFGEQKIPLSSLASMEFLAGEPEDPREPGTFYRKGSEPLPGSLIWVRDKDIAIRSPLGVMSVARASALRFVLATPTPPEAPAGDELGLSDGTILFGATNFDGNEVVIRHETLGEIKIPWSSVHYLRRNIPGLVWIDEVPRTVIETIGPALPPPAPRLARTVSESHARSLRIMPHTVLRLTLPPSGEPAVFRGELHPVPGNQAQLEVSLLNGDSPLWSRKISSGTEPIPISLDLPRSEELTIKVTFDGPLSFPCGIDLRDAHVIHSNNLKPE